MTLEEHLKVQSKRWKEEGRLEGRLEGEQRARMDDVRKLVTAGICSEEKACEIIDVSIEDYEEYIKMSSN